MSQLTVDYGIDLGTTNSAICRMGARGPERINNNHHQAATPSVVGISRKGQLKVGQDALRHDYEPQRRFKREMGSDTKYKMADGTEWTPQQLSAEVLKDLKASVKRRFNEDIDTVVITVPAMFNQPQCEATREAARMAGLNAVALLQEPIAAATAFLSANPREGYYLVYDLGGGTFDCSLIRLKDGEMNVVEHGGDNYLGGSDFDRIVFDWVLAQVAKRVGETEQFEASAARFKLMQEVERARIELSDEDEVLIDLGDFDLPLDALALSRSQLQAMLEPHIDRTLEVARDRLRSANINASEVRSLLLVGGPTRTPYLREKLAELGIPLNFEQDPMTVVAEGAAIHASTILKKGGDSKPLAGSGAVLDLHYEPVTPETTALVAGKVTDPTGFTGDIRLVSEERQTGWIPLVKGAFSVEVVVDPGAVVTFAIELRDGQGGIVQCTPSGFAIRSGVRTAQAILPYNYGVSDEHGNVTVLLKSGAPVPTPAETVTFRATKDVPAGSPEEFVIYFVEGNSRVADENTRVGQLQITGKDLERGIKAGQPVEVRMRSDESRSVIARVFLPVQDAEFKLELKSITESPDFEALEEQLARLRLNLSRIEDEVAEEDENAILQVNRRVELLEADMEKAERGETGEALRTHKQLSDLQVSLRPLLDKYSLPALHARALKAVSDAKYWANRFNDSIDLAKLDDMAKEADRYRKLEDEKLLEDVRSRAMGLYWKHYGRTPECWQGQINLLRERSFWARDEYAFHEYVKRAETCLQGDDLTGARLNVMEAWDLLPDLQRIRDGLRSDLER